MNRSVLSCGAGKGSILIPIVALAAITAWAQERRPVALDSSAAIEVAWDLCSVAYDPIDAYLYQIRVGMDQTATDWMHPRITVGPDTTRLTAPLTSAGYVDYRTAMNRLRGERVRADDNVAVALLKVFDPDRTSWPFEAYLRELEIPPEHVEGSFLRFYDYVEHLTLDSPNGTGQDKLPASRLREQMVQATIGPWTRDQYPAIFAWLNENRKALESVAEACQRPTFYLPLVARDTTAPVALVFEQGRLHTKWGDILNVVRCRQWLHVGENRPADVLADSILLQRLSRCLNESPSPLIVIRAKTEAAVMSQQDAELLRNGRVSGALARRHLADLNHLKAIPSLADAYDGMGRYEFLSEVQYHAYRGPGELIQLMDLEQSANSLLRDVTGTGSPDAQSPPQRPVAPLCVWLPAWAVNWNRLCLRVNEHCDRAVAVLRMDASERLDAAAKFDEDQIRRPLHAASAEDLESSLASGRWPHVVLQEDYCTLFERHALAALAPSARLEVEFDLRFDLVRIGFALLAYHGVHKKYPERLDSLTPEFLPKIPSDPFSGGSLKYRTEEAEFLVYSVGPDGVDDAGAMDANTSPTGNGDLLIRGTEPVLLQSARVRSPMLP